MRRGVEVSGHSKWATIKRKKGVTDAKRGALFTKLGNQIAIAARSGTDPTSNSALSMAIEKAKAANMPMSNIERSIARVKDKSAVQLEEITYEGYGPGGIAVIVEVATDNKNRTYPEVRLAFTKHGGSMAEPGSVAFQFTHKGIIRFRGTGEQLQLQAIEAGADDIYEEPETNETVIYTAANELAKVRSALIDSGVEVVEAQLGYEPNNIIKIEDAETARKVINLMDTLEDIEEVTNTYTNFDIPEDINI
ncbi:TPA: YebC/PmpR family DNA-binding transcriptional regulator [Candidatus Saccharibacteria bacterium]|nr:YebC/PmpR family DNA-binding transcriptional regulator [Candidatus Saccharibacteria bacterium]